MDDLELIKLAGKAADIEYTPETNPLNDDALALRLAVKLRLDVMTDCPNSVCIEVPIGKKDNWITENTGDDSFENVLIATRRAIVRAAAEIGRGME